MAIIAFFYLIWRMVTGVVLFAFRHPVLAGIFTIFTVLTNIYTYALGNDIAEADFPKLIHVLGVVQQPNGLTTVIKVRNDAKYLLTAKEMTFVCWSSHSFIRGYSSSPYFAGGLEQEWEIVEYRPSSSDGYVPPGTVQDVVIKTKNAFQYDLIDLTRCSVGATKQQAAKLAGLTVYADGKVNWGQKLSDANAHWRPTFPVLPPEPKQ